MGASKELYKENIRDMLGCIIHIFRTPVTTSHIFLHPASSVWITVTHELSTLAGLAIQDEHLQRTSCRGETIFLLKIAENHQGGHIYHLGGGKNQIKGLNLSGFLQEYTLPISFFMPLIPTEIWSEL